MSGDVEKQPMADQSGRANGNRTDAPRATGVRRATIAVGICAVAIAGCSSLALPELPTPAVPRPGIGTTAPPAALSPSAYQEELRSASSAMAPVFDLLANSRSPEEARTVLKQGSMAAWEAARVLDVDPPAEVLAIHHDLRAGLQQLATDLSQFGDQVESMELCAAPSILATVSNAPAVSSLRTVREALGSGRLGATYQWGAFLPENTALPERRLADGHLVDSVRRTGTGELKVENDSESDGVLKLVQDGKPIVSVYVGTGSNATVTNIDDGTYDVFYTSGIDWDDQLETFTRSCRFQRFEITAEFTTTSTQYTIWTIDIQPKDGGNIRTAEVPAESFPR